MQYGVLVCVLFAACSSPHGVAVDAGLAVDAMPDAESCPPDVQVDGCVFDGLVGLPFDGTTAWTWTGTRSDGQQTSPFSTQDTGQMEQMSIDFKTTGILTHP